MAPSLLERRRAQEASSCTVERALLAAFSTAALGLFALSSTISTPTVQPHIRTSDLAKAAMHHRRLRPAQAEQPQSPAATRTPPPLSLSPPPPSNLAAPSSETPLAVADGMCHARPHTDYMGEQAPVWGLGRPGFHLNSAASCCTACQAHAAVCGKPGAAAKSWWPARPELRCGHQPGCNIWVYCPLKQCFAFDIHVHTQGECWLKYQRANVTAPKDPHEGHQTFPAAMRRSPRKLWPWAVDVSIWSGDIPERVPWISGVLAPAEAVVKSAPADDPWRRRWCEKHGGAYGGCD